MKCLRSLPRPLLNACFCVLLCAAFCGLTGSTPHAFAVASNSLSIDEAVLIDANGVAQVSGQYTCSPKGKVKKMQNSQSLSSKLYLLRKGVSPMKANYLVTELLSNISFLWWLKVMQLLINRMSQQLALRPPVRGRLKFS